MPIKHQMITARQFADLLNIKSMTTFNKRAKDPGFPQAYEYPPGTKTRSWRLGDVEQYVNHLTETAAPWPVCEEQPA